MPKTAKTKGLTKREFIKAVGASVLGVAALPAATTAGTGRWHDREVYDVIVIGAGFAGVTAAREVSRGGLRTVILEARNRLGGRTFYSKFGDQPVELGGTWIHWGQPHVWAEVMRYGLPIAETKGVASPQRFLFSSEGRVVEKSPDEGLKLSTIAMDKYCEQAPRVFPRPFDPFFHEKLVFELDKLSLEDRLRQIKLPPEQWALVASFLDAMGSAPRQNCAYIDMLRWWALSGNDIGRLFDMTVRYRFRDGTISLINAMLADSNAEVKLSTPVSRIDQDAKQVHVTTETGRTYVGRMAIVTVPMNTLTGIDFSPPLDPRKVEASKQRMAGSGTKVWIKVKGKLPLVVAQAPGPQPFAFLFTEEQGPDGGYMIGFSSSRQWLDPKDKAAVAKAVHQFMPGLEVEEVLNYDWDLDPYSLGTWCVYRPGQATKYWRALRRPEGRLYFASADSALGWRGFIDGAIESGLQTGYLVTAALHKERHTKA